MHAYLLLHRPVVLGRARADFTSENVAKRRTKEENDDLLRKIEEYIEKTDIPIIAEFAYLNKVPRTSLYDNPILSVAIKTLIDKKEAQLERKALNKEIDKTMAIFSLKQLGWRDVQEMNVGFSPKEITERFAEMVSNAGAGSATS